MRDLFIMCLLPSCIYSLHHPAHHAGTGDLALCFQGQHPVSGASLALQVEGTNSVPHHGREYQQRFITQKTWASRG